MSANPKMSNKDVRNGYPSIFVASYCAWQATVSMCDWPKVGHASGVYGWNWDCFEIKNDQCLITGYRGFPKETVTADYEKMKAFEHEAEEISRSWSFKSDADYKKRKKAFKKKVEKYLQSRVDAKIAEFFAKRKAKEERDAERERKRAEKGLG